MYKLFRFLEKQHTDNISIKNILLSPLLLVLEIYVKFRIWRGVVRREMITNDNIFHFLDTEDFELRRDKFIKMDTVEDSRYLMYSNDMEKVRTVIRYDYIEAFINLLQSNSSFDIENYISLSVSVEQMYVKDDVGIYHSDNVFIIIVQYVRNIYVKNAWKCFGILLSILIFIAATIMIILYLIK